MIFQLTTRELTTECALAQTLCHYLLRKFGIFLRSLDLKILKFFKEHEYR